MSNNVQKIIEYAKDPSCVACITPHFGGAWHSLIRDQYQPRNFVAGGNVAWTDFTNFYKAIGSNDFSLRIKFTINKIVNNTLIFQCSAATGQAYTGVYIGLSGNIGTSTSITSETTTAINLATSGNYETGREYTFEVSRISGVLNISFDNVVFLNVADQTNIDCSTLSSSFRTTAGCSISEVYLVDLGTNTSYSAPHDALWQSNPQPVLPPVAGDSIAQRLGLLTKNNCDTSQLDFRLASTSLNNWYVKTGISFAGWSRPLTIIGRMYVAPDNGGSSAFDYETNVFHPMISQGWPAGGVGPGLVFGMYYTNQTNANQYRVAMTLASGAGVILSATPLVPPHGRVVALGVTIDNNTGRWSIYEDGVLLNSAINSNLVGFALLADTSNVNNDATANLHQRITSWQNLNDIEYYVAVYDVVKNAAGIKFLST